jgi:hypothetical protein
MKNSNNFLQKHIENYDPKKPWSSPRGIVVVLISLSFGLALLEFVKSGSTEYILGGLISLAVLAPFLYFILKGKIWAMVSIITVVALLLLLTLLGGSYQGILWNFVIIYFLFQSIQIERGRKNSL